jgi:outer membrane receptor protein involved in Fe transport
LSLPGDDAGLFEAWKKMKVSVRRHLLLSTAILVAGPALLSTIPAKADSATDTADSTYQEVVVTAQKRTSTVQKTPISISAVSGFELQDRGVTSVTDLVQATPGVSLKSEGPGQTEIELRGMTSSGGSSATVGFYLDDIPLSPPAGAQNGKVVIDPTLYDLNRIEVLRGPQGTLFGSGSMGGTVRLITNQPDPTAFHASAQSILSGTEGGSFNHNNNFMLNIPLIDDKLALRVVGSEGFTSGWIDRIVAGNYPLVSTDGATRGNVQAAPVLKKYSGSNAEQSYGARFTLLWKPTDELTVTPSFFYQTSHQDGISAYDSSPGTLAHYQPFDIAEPLTDRIAVSSVTAAYALESFDITSITSYFTRTSTQTEESSEDFNNPDTGATYASNNGLPNPGYYGPNGTGQVQGHEVDPSSQFTEELRFTSKDDDVFTWVGGAYYSHYSAIWSFDGVSANPSAYMDLGTFAPATTTSWFHAISPTTEDQYALFGEGTYTITDGLKANIGLRFYGYNYKFSSTITGWGSALGAATPSTSGLIKLSEVGVNPKFNLSYEFDKDLLVYVTAAKGFRPGGGNAQYPTSGPYWSAVFAPYNFPGGKWPTSYKSDSVWSYEIGEKARFFDRRLTVNASAYYEDWNNVQLLALPGDWAENINGNSAKIFGGEIETRATLGGGFQLEADAGFVHAQVDPGPHWQITPAHKLPDVAPVTANINLTYATDLTEVYSFSARIENSYVGQRFSLAFPYGYSLNGGYFPLPAYDLTNIRAGIQSTAGWGASVFANNLFNKHAQLENLFQETLPSASFNRVVTNQPLTVGIDLTYKF